MKWFNPEGLSFLLRKNVPSLWVLSLGFFELILKRFLKTGKQCRLTFSIISEVFLTNYSDFWVQWGLGHSCNWHGNLSCVGNLCVVCTMSLFGAGKLFIYCFLFTYLRNIELSAVRWVGVGDMLVPTLRDSDEWRRSNYKQGLTI